MVGAISSADPMVLVGEFYKQPVGGNRDLTGKTRRDIQTIPVSTTAAIIVAGQSNSCSLAPNPAPVSNPAKVHNLNFYDGAVYGAADPLLGCQIVPRNPGIGNPFTRMADKLVTDGKYTDVILVPVGIGGTSINEWVTNPSLSLRVLVAARRVAALGFPVKGITWMQGETDCGIGTSQAAYAADLATLIGIPRQFGFNAPWLIGKCSYNTGVVSAAVQAAQFGAANGSSIFTGADCDAYISATYRQSDQTHLTDAGVIAVGDAWAARVEAVL